ncbi:DinB family protein [Clostridium oryzae]|uniref:DinB superfamily protein n=1 Tax=Clostridium oryzae TaxID=1450648 RepID=A0A1V4IK47_9CLOT|nr:DinB family protein [Clostridium oryzae]OPJ60391.1 hypothetical protein CLORY_28430 [Clostridium oryzae]
MEQKEVKFRRSTETARNQFDSCYVMLEKLVNICPDEIWYEYFNEVPFWYQVYHVTYFIDYWFRDTYDGSDFKSMEFDEKIPPEFEYDVERNLSISREDMKEYVSRIHVKTARIFDRLDDKKMADSIIDGQDGFTYMDIIMSQVRHIMYNIGYLNGILRSKGLEESDWYAYNEEEE